MTVILNLSLVSCVVLAPITLLLYNNYFVLLLHPIPVYCLSNIHASPSTHCIREGNTKYPTVKCLTFNFNFTNVIGRVQKCLVVSSTSTVKVSYPDFLDNGLTLIKRRRTTKKGRFKFTSWKHYHISQHSLHTLSVCSYSIVWLQRYFFFVYWGKECTLGSF